MIGLHTFLAYELRTRDTGAAQGFYRAVLGIEVSVSQLPERAGSRGAPSHWLGHVDVDDVEDTAGHVVALGGERLGPTRELGGGTSAALRDPLGSVVAVCGAIGRGPAPVRPEVAWHELHTADRARAQRVYAELFGWAARDTLELGLPAGPYTTFAWSAGGPAVGGILESARAPGIHPHWLFYFVVTDLERALASVRAHGGQVLHGPADHPAGGRAAQCEDPQGAAFALLERG